MADNLIQKLEVLLFMCREPLKKEKLVKMLEVDEDQIDKALESLMFKYNSDEYGLQIVNISEGYQFATKPQYADVLKKYINAPVETGLSNAAMETLSIIAYRQPITRAEVEAIRGVNSDGIIKSLLDKELIKEQGKSEAIGRPVIYGTTEDFLKHFGLKNVEDLPDNPRNKMDNAEKEIIEKITILTNPD